MKTKEAYKRLLSKKTLSNEDEDETESSINFSTFSRINNCRTRTRKKVSFIEMIKKITGCKIKLLQHFLRFKISYYAHKMYRLLTF